MLLSASKVFEPTILASLRSAGVPLLRLGVPVALSLLILVAPARVSADEALSPELQAILTKAQAGDPEAQFRMGAAYDWGRGAPRSGVEAMKWYRMAAERGHVEAQNSMGSVLQAEERYGEALPWYERAAKQNHALATNNLAYLHDLGLGVKQNRQKAFELYSRAADLGWAESMWNIANMYGAGQIGQNKDLFMACVWTLRARSNSDPASKTFELTSAAFSYLQDELGNERFSECRDKADKWAPAIQDGPRTAGSRP